MFLLLYLGIIFGFFLLVLFLTFGSNGWDYMSIDAVVANLENNFLIGLYVALPAVLVFLVTIATKSTSFAHYNWWIAVGIGVVRILILLVTSRWRLIRAPLLALATAASILLAYFVCHAVLSDKSTLTTLSPGLLVTMMWFVTVLILAKLLSEARFGNLDEDSAYNGNVYALYAKYSKHFDQIIAPYFRKDPVAYRLLFAIMISEDINRPGIVRLTERMLFPFKNIATTGIMQVTAKEYLSNQKSVSIAQEIIKGSYNRNKREVKEEYSLVRAVANDYNGGVYPELVADIYFILKEREYKYSKSAI
jgi:hypothetical protein